VWITGERDLYLAAGLLDWYSINVGQLRVVYEATGEYMAIAVRDGLAAQNIGSVQLLNEIPMKPGFTFGARPWAEILVRDADLTQAIEVVAEVEQSLNGDADSQLYPPAINLRPAVWPKAAWISFLLLLPAIASASLVLVFGLAFLNLRLLRNATVAALGGLLALPVFALWLVVCSIPGLIRLVAALCRQLINALIRLGEPD